jgi:type II secretory pathway pseudopilin PulG
MHQKERATILKPSLAHGAGYTIVEMIVSVGIFSLAFTAIASIFVSFINVQGRASTAQRLLNEDTYILTSIASDIRNSMMDYDSTGCTIASGATLICLKTPEGKFIRYKYATDTVYAPTNTMKLKVCKSFTESLCDFGVFNSTNPALSQWTLKKSAFVTINALNFQVFPTVSPKLISPSNSPNTLYGYQPGVTILMKVSAGTNRSAQSYDLQTTVLSRVYTY